MLPEVEQLNDEAGSYRIDEIQNVRYKCDGFTHPHPQSCRCAL